MVTNRGSGSFRDQPRPLTQEGGVPALSNSLKRPCVRPQIDLIIEVIKLRTRPHSARYIIIIIIISFYFAQVKPSIHSKTVSVKRLEPDSEAQKEQLTAAPESLFLWFHKKKQL